MCVCVFVWVCVACSHRPIGVLCDGCVCLCLGWREVQDTLHKFLITHVQHIDAQTQSYVVSEMMHLFIFIFIAHLRSLMHREEHQKRHLIHSCSLSRVLLL